MSNLPVYFEQRLVGTIDVDKSGPGFRYDAAWIGLRGSFPISTTMPFTVERIAADTFLPWAANLLPESEQLRTLGQLLGMARNDVIGLLSAIGGDAAGALSIGQPARTASVQWRPVGHADDLERLIDGLPNKPFLVGDEGVSMSLAGAQTKLAVAVDDARRICIPMNGSPSTHILKASGDPRRRRSRRARRAAVSTSLREDTTGRTSAAAGVAYTRRTIAKRSANPHPPSTNPIRPASRVRLWVTCSS
jgi:serine/threonine-protein kinase HipA